MVPTSIATQLREGKPANPEYFVAVTVLFFDIGAFDDMLKECPPCEIIALLNSLTVEMEKELAKHDVYKVEIVQDSCMLVSGKVYGFLVLTLTG